MPAQKWKQFQSFRSRLVLLAADLFQPVNHFAIEVFLNGNVRYDRGGRGALSVFLAGRKPYQVGGMNLLNWAAFARRASTAGGHDERLSQRMSVPGGAGAGFKRDVGNGHAGGSRGLHQTINIYIAREPLGRSFVRWL